MPDSYVQSNRELWNSWTRLHAQSDSEHYDLERFRAGQTTLQEIERQELGDVSGKRLLHLQCHFGLDTLSWAREGALATGVDFADQAIRLARALSRELGIRADFVCSDLYALPQVLDRRFDIVFTSYGVLPWLPDLDRWAEIIVHYVRPGGIFYIVEAHPVRRIALPRRVDDAGKPVECGYFGRDEPEQVVERGSYAQPGAKVVHTANYWTHGLGEIVTALSSAGLRLEYLHEFPKRIKNCCAYVATGTGEYEAVLRTNVEIPNLFSIRARR